MFAGCLSFEQPLSAWGDPSRILAALAPYSQSAPRDVWVSNRQMLLQVATRNDAPGAAIFRHVASGVAVAFWGRLDNRSDLIHRLEAHPKVSDDELIALAWLKWGECCPERLIGDFAFAVANPNTGVIFLARDIIGVKPLYYRQDENGFVFANSAAAFKPLRLGNLTPSREWMARFLTYGSASHTDTAYMEIKKLAPAHSMLVTADGNLVLRRFHQFTDDAPRVMSRDPRWLESYRAIWQESIACRMPNIGVIGCENSGGIDSGSITAEVSRMLGKNINRLRCFGYCRERLEPEAIMSVAMRYGIAHNFISSRPYDYNYLPEVIDRSLAVNGYPIEIGVAEDHDEFYQIAARQNVGVLFSGFGGDELVTSQNGEAFEEFSDNREYRNLYNITSGSPFRKLYRMGRYLWTDRVAPRTVNLDRKIFAERWKWTFFTADAEAEFNLRESYIGANDYAHAQRSVNALALVEIHRNHVPVRMENCTLMAASHGIDYVWPLLDPRLIQQWLSTPTLWKVGSGRSFRYLHRRAIEGVCPDKIIMKQQKDMGGAEIQRNFETRTNRYYFQQLFDISENIPENLRDIVDIDVLRKIALKGLNENAMGYEVFSAMLMLNRNLQALVAWSALNMQQKSR